MAKIIAIANQKGGVAKTTTTMNLADALTHLGQRVLMIDADPQGTLSTNLGHDLDHLTSQNKTLAHCFAGDVVVGDAVIGSSPAIIVSSDLLNVVDDHLEDDFIQLRDIVTNIDHGYDFILVDCGPGLSKVMRNALGCADFVLIPVKTDKSSADGIGRLVDTINRLADTINPQLHILGILPTMYMKRLKHDNDTLNYLRTTFSPMMEVFDPIPFSTWYNRAAESLKSVFSMRRSAPGTAQYEKLANYLIQLP